MYSQRTAINSGQRANSCDCGLAMRLLPPSATPTANLILITRGMRSVADGCISVLLPAYLLVLGFDALQVGLLTTATLLGSALLTLAVGFYGSRVGVRTLLLATSLLMLATGIGFAAVAGLLAPSAHRVRRHAQPVGGRRQRLPAAGADGAERRHRRSRPHRPVRSLQPGGLAARRRLARCSRSSLTILPACRVSIASPSFSRHSSRMPRSGCWFG